MTTREVLIQARALIETEDKWWNGRWPEKSYETHCAMTAMAEIAEDEASFQKAIHALVQEMGPVAAENHHWEVPGFNDSHTHAEVLAIFDRAIDATIAPAQELVAA